MSKRVAMICGYPSRGKTTALRNLDRVLHVNCESEAKEPAFSYKNKKAFKTVTLSDPDQLQEAFEFAESNPDYHTIVIDGFNFLMDMYESQKIINSTDTRAGWQNYGQFIKYIMQTLVANSSKNIIFLAHIEDIYNKQDMATYQKVPIKGSVGKTGIEAYFTTILQAERVDLETLQDVKNDLLHITEDEQEDGYKYVLQTRVNKGNIGSNIRTPMGLFARNEQYIDSDIALVINRLNEYYD